MDTNTEDKRLFLIMLRSLDTNYIMIRFLNAFFEMSSAQQDSFVGWMHKQIGDDRWDEVANDRMQYKEFIKALIMHHSGLEVKSEPTLKDLKSMIGEYLRSEEYKNACASAIYEKELTFSEQLEDL